MRWNVHTVTAVVVQRTMTCRTCHTCHFCQGNKNLAPFSHEFLYDAQSFANDADNMAYQNNKYAPGNSAWQSMLV